MNAIVEGADAPSSPAHSPFGASGFHRRIGCPGSYHAEKDLPEESSPYAREGTAGHFLAAECLTNGTDAIGCEGSLMGIGDGGDPVELDETVCEGVQVYLDKIRADQAARGGKLLIETKFHLDHLHPLFYGTADCVRIGADGVMTVYDLKLGRGKIVEVADSTGCPNIQLAYYGIGALHACDRVVKSLSVSGVELVVVQPRAWHKDGPVRRRTWPIAQIEVVGAELKAAARGCEKPDAPRVAGDHCQFCKAAATCTALRQLAFDTAQMDFDDSAIPPYVPSDAADISRTLEAIGIMEDWISAVRAHAFNLAASSSGLPGWKLVDKQARRKWKDEEKAAQALIYDFGVDENSIYDKKLLSPAQVEKKLPPVERKSEAFKALCPAISSGSTLVRADNPKPERKPVQAEFGDGLSDEGEW